MINQRKFGEGMGLVGTLLNQQTKHASQNSIVNATSPSKPESDWIRPIGFCQNIIQ